MYVIVISWKSSIINLIGRNSQNYLPFIKEKKKPLLNLTLFALYSLQI